MPTMCRFPQLQQLTLVQRAGWKQHAVIDGQLGNLNDNNHFNYECCSLLETSFEFPAFDGNLVVDGTETTPVTFLHCLLQ